MVSLERDLHKIHNFVDRAMLIVLHLSRVLQKSADKRFGTEREMTLSVYNNLQQHYGILQGIRQVLGREEELHELEHKHAERFLEHLREAIRQRHAQEGIERWRDYATHMCREAGDDKKLLQKLHKMLYEGFIRRHGGNPAGLLTPKEAPRYFEQGALCNEWIHLYKKLAKTLEELYRFIRRAEKIEDHIERDFQSVRDIISVGNTHNIHGTEDSFPELKNAVEELEDAYEKM